MTLSPVELYALIADWIRNRKKNQDAKIGHYKIYPNRLQLVFQTADQQQNENFFRDKPSPLKIAACFCYAIATERPLYNTRLAKAEAGDKIALLKEEQEMNAALSFEIAMRLVDISEFECCPGVKPPYGINYPSKHFKLEIRKSLARNIKVNAPGLAFILELLLYRSQKGKDIRGTSDGEIIDTF